MDLVAALTHLAKTRGVREGQVAVVTLQGVAVLEREEAMVHRLHVGPDRGDVAQTAVHPSEVIGRGTVGSVAGRTERIIPREIGDIGVTGVAGELVGVLEGKEGVIMTGGPLGDLVAAATVEGWVVLRVGAIARVTSAAVSVETAEIGNIRVARVARQGVGERERKEAVVDAGGPPVRRVAGATVPPREVVRCGPIGLVTCAASAGQSEEAGESRVAALTGDGVVALEGEEAVVDPGIGPGEVIVTRSTVEAGKVIGRTFDFVAGTTRRREARRVGKREMATRAGERVAILEREEAVIDTALPG